MMRLKLVGIAGLLIAFIANAPTLAFDEWDAYEPPALTCYGGELGLVLSVGSDGCVQLSGNAAAGVGTAIGDEIDYAIRTSARAALISEGDLPIAFVLGTRASRQQEWPPFDPLVDAPFEPIYVSRFDLTEAFVKLGEQNYIQAGLLDATFDSLAPESSDFAWLTSIDPFIGENYQYLGDMPIGGFGVQGGVVIGDALSLAAGVENLEGQTDPGQYPFDNLGMAGTVIAAIQYDDETSSGKLSLVAGGLLDGQFDEWSASGFLSSNISGVEILAVGQSSGDGIWLSGFSASTSIADIFYPSVAVFLSDYGTELDASVDIGNPQDGPSIGLAGRLLIGQVGELRISSSTIVAEQAKITLSLGRYVGIYGEGAYVQIEGDWQPTETTQLSVSGSAYDTGGASLSVSAEQRLK